jgi:hypothetical protein
MPRSRSQQSKAVNIIVNFIKERFDGKSDKTLTTDGHWKICVLDQSMMMWLGMRFGMKKL